MRLFVTVLFVAAAFAPAFVRAGEFNAVLNIGDAAPEWKELPGVDGKTHSLGDLKEKKVVVVIFTCNSCPVAADYEDRIIAFANEYSDRVGVVAINVNRIPEDSLEMMKKRAEEKKFPFPYLFDESQKIAKDYGAAFTPEFFVLSPERKIVYMGGMDDSSNPAQVKNNFLAPAVEAALAGVAPEKAETAAIGCRIRFARERRSKTN
jgi:peroxiredoxin